MIVVLTICMIYASLVPLVPLAGGMFFVIKFYADKYALLYVRPRPSGKGEVALTAGHTTLWCLVLSVLAFIVIEWYRNSASGPRFTLSFGYCLWACFCAWKYCHLKRQMYEREKFVTEIRGDEPDGEESATGPRMGAGVVADSVGKDDNTSLPTLKRTKNKLKTWMSSRDLLEVVPLNKEQKTQYVLDHLELEHAGYLDPLIDRDLVNKRGVNRRNAIPGLDTPVNLARTGRVVI